MLSELLTADIKDKYNFLKYYYFFKQVPAGRIGKPDE